MENKFEKWAEEQPEWKKLLLCIAVAMIGIAAGIFFLVMPVVWACRFWSLKPFLIWIVLCGIAVGFEIYKNIF